RARPAVVGRSAAALVLALLLAACAQSTPRQEIVLGAIYPMSGPQASGGKSELAGVQAALRASDAGVRLEVIDATTPQAAAAAADTLVRHYHVPAILGTYGSTLSAAASARARATRTPEPRTRPRAAWRRTAPVARGTLATSGTASTSGGRC